MRRLQRHLALALCWFVQLGAQQLRVVHGFVSDSSSSEMLVGATVRVPGTRLGTFTDAHGFYSLRQADTVRALVVTFVGYHNRSVPISAGSENQRLDIRLSPSPVESPAVLVEGAMIPRPIDRPATGISDFRIEEARHFPSVAGELDVVKAVHALPGVSTGEEYSNGFYVRGGNVDQNLILMDGFPLYNTNHFFGYFSVFNGDAIQRVELKRSGIPAEYGGRLSSVLEIQLKEGSRERYGITGGVSLLAARVSAEGPLGAERDGSFIISARRTYVDPVLWIINSGSSFGDRTDIYFYDVVAKANYSLSNNDRVFVTGYFGRDVLTDRSSYGESGIIWGNSAFLMRYDRVWSPTLFTHFSVLYSDYRSNFFRTGSYEWRKRPSIIDVTFRSSGELYLSADHTIRFGAEATRHRILAYAGVQEFDNTDEAAFASDEVSLFSSHEWSISPAITTVGGIRAAWFSTGHYRSIEPRLSIRYLVTDRSAIKASATRMYQFIHLLSSVSFANPGDVFYPSTDFLQPEVSDQVAVSYSQTTDETPMFTAPQEWVIEAYYKTMKHLPLFRSTFSSPNPEVLRGDLLSGEGLSYGVEVEYKLNMPRLDLRMAYTLSGSTRTFDEKNQGEPFSANFDRTHQLFVSGDFRWKQHWTVGAQFILSSGRPISLPGKSYTLSGLPGDATNSREILDFGRLNSVRQPLYNRLDVSLTYSYEAWGGNWEIFMNLYNAYAYPNPLLIVYSRTTVEKFSLGFIPTIGVNFKY